MTYNEGTSGSYKGQCRTCYGDQNPDGSCDYCEKQPNEYRVVYSTPISNEVKTIVWEKTWRDAVKRIDELEIETSLIAIQMRFDGKWQDLHNAAQTIREGK